MLLKSATAKWERLREQWQSRFPLNPEDPSADSWLQACNSQLTYIIGFNLTALSRPGLDPVKHSACHLPDNLQSLVPSNTFDSVCVFGQKK